MVLYCTYSSVPAHKYYSYFFVEDGSQTASSQSLLSSPQTPHNQHHSHSNIVIKITPCSRVGALIPINHGEEEAAKTAEAEVATATAAATKTAAKAKAQSANAKANAANALATVAFASGAAVTVSGITPVDGEEVSRGLRIAPQRFEALQFG